MRKVILMSAIIEALLAMPYYKNYAAASGLVHNIANHESAVQAKLEQFGLKETKGHETKGFIKTRDKWLEDPTSCDMKEGTFICQPCGTHNSPDFIVKMHGRAYFLECKSAGGRTVAPMYNSGIPKRGYIYIFTCERYNETTIYFGEDVCPPEHYNMIKEHVEKRRIEDEQLNLKLSNQYGLNFYTRPMITHVGGTDYFRNEYREQIEQGVLNAV